MLIGSIVSFILGLPLYGKIVLVALVCLIVFAIVKKFIKLAIYVAAFVILILVIMKLVN